MKHANTRIHICAGVVGLWVLYSNGGCATVAAGLDKYQRACAKIDIGFTDRARRIATAASEASSACSTTPDPDACTDRVQAALADAEEALRAAEQAYGVGCVVAPLELERATNTLDGVLAELGGTKR